VKTKITVKDQTTIVIGGLIQDRVVTGVRKTPLLGDIPVLGWLFRDQTTTKTKTNLLLFLTPYIIRDHTDYRRILERKRREQKEFMEQMYGAQAPAYDAVVEWERKGGPYAKLRRDVDTETQKFENGGRGAPGEGAVGPDVKPDPRLQVRPPGPPAPAKPPASPRPGTPAPGTPRSSPSGTAPGPAPEPGTPTGAAPAAAPGEPDPATAGSSASLQGVLPAWPSPPPEVVPGPPPPRPAPANP